MSRIWLITGASSGLGEALSESAIKRGDKVVATFRRQDQAEHFSQSRGNNGLGIVMDVTQEEQVRAGIEKSISHFGRVDVLVNNAGYGTIGAVEECSMEEIRTQMETNFFGMVSLTKLILPIMRAQGGGHILQISSASGFKATAGFGIYNASKFALEGLSEALAQELAPFNIKVVIVEPGPFRTKFAGGSVQLARQKIEAYHNTPAAQMYHYISRIDGQQEGDPQKAAEAMIDYVYENHEPLRLPLGKQALANIRAKLAAVQKDLEINESIALSVVYNTDSQ